MLINQLLRDKARMESKISSLYLVVMIFDFAVIVSIHYMASMVYIYSITSIIRTFIMDRQIKRPAIDACLCMGELPALAAPPAPHFVFLITL